MRVPESSVYVHRVVRPRSETFIPVIVMCVVVRARVARVVRVLEDKVLTIVHTLQRLEVA